MGYFLNPPFKVTVEESVEQNDKLKPPAITVCSIPGWHGSSGSQEFYGFYKRECKNETTSEGFFACIENRTFSFSELVLNAGKGLGSDKEDLSDFKFWTWDGLVWVGVTH